jgi:hypothetical protein
MSEIRQMRRGDMMRHMAKIQATIDALRRKHDEQSDAKREELQRQLNDLWQKFI